MSFMHLCMVKYERRAIINNLFYDNIKTPVYNKLFNDTENDNIYTNQFNCTNYEYVENTYMNSNNTNSNYDGTFNNIINNTFDNTINNTFNNTFNNISDLENYLNETENKKYFKYRPEITRGKGVLREGYCKQCDKWLKLKTSNYWYHMNYMHGINTNGQKYPNPELRIIKNIKQGFCKECSKWIDLGKNTNGMRYNWFKHWKKVHCKARSI